MSPMIQACIKYISALRTRTKSIGLARQVCRAIRSINSKSGVCTSDIRKFLTRGGTPVTPVALRKAIEFALKAGVIMRPQWAADAGVFGKYELAQRNSYFADLTDNTANSGSCPRKCSVPGCNPVPAYKPSNLDDDKSCTAKAARKS